MGTELGTGRLNSVVFNADGATATYQRDGDSPYEYHSVSVLWVYGLLLIGEMGEDDPSTTNLLGKRVQIVRADEGATFTALPENAQAEPPSLIAILRQEWAQQRDELETLRASQRNAQVDKVRIEELEAQLAAVRRALK